MVGKTFPAFPAHAQPAILHILQEAHAKFIILPLIRDHLTIRTTGGLFREVPLYHCASRLIRAKVPGGEGGVAPPPSPSALCLPISVLDMETDCEAERGLHNLIRRKFTTIMERDFKPVPSNPDFFIYCPQQYQQEEQVWKHHWRLTLYVLSCFEEGFQAPVPSRHWQMIEHADFAFSIICWC